MWGLVQGDLLKWMQAHVYNCKAAVEVARGSGLRNEFFYWCGQGVLAIKVVRYLQGKKGVKHGRK